MEAKAELLAMVQGLTEGEAERLLDYINNLNDPDDLTPEETVEHHEAMAEYERGETITLQEARAKYDL